MEDSRILRWLKFALYGVFVVTALAVTVRPELLRTGVGILVPVLAAILLLQWLTDDPSFYD